MIARQPLHTVVVVLMLALTATPMTPEVITVGGTCNLNAAINAANNDLPAGDCPAGSGADTIRLTANVLLDTVDPDHSADGANGLPSVTSKILIEGNGFDVFRDFILAPDFRIFHVSASGDLTLNDVGVLFGEITSTTRLAGGGLFNRGKLALYNSTVNANRVESTGRALGGGIYAAPYSTTRIRASDILNNTATGGAMARGAGVALGDQAVLEVATSTFDNNTAEASLGRGQGSAISAAEPGTTDWGIVSLASSTVSNNEAIGDFYAHGAVQGPYLTITNSTISGNTATTDSLGGSEATAGVHGAGTIDHSTFFGNQTVGHQRSAVRGEVYYGTSPPHPGLMISSSIFASTTGDHCFGTITDGGHGNLADDATCLVEFGTLTGLNTSLAANGGPTETHALISGSSAIDPLTATCAELGTDQRGAARVAPCDSGAFEYLGDACPLLEIRDATVSAPFGDSACHTALLGPNLIVQSGFDISAPHLISLADGFVAESGSLVRLSVSP